MTTNSTPSAEDIAHMRAKVRKFLDETDGFR